MFDKFNLAQLVRYGYTGFLIAGIFTYLTPEAAKEFFGATGNVVAPLIVFSAGGSVFVFYRYILGEFVLFPITHLIHCHLDKWPPRKTSRPTGFLREIGIPRFQIRAAYTEIRRNYFKKEESVAASLDLSHTETHVLWITSIIGLGTFIFLCVSNSTEDTTQNIFLGISCIFALAAIITDIQQHKKEHRLFTSEKYHQEIIEFLTAQGYSVKQN